jgi:lipid-A-disaccharide synthase
VLLLAGEASGDYHAAALVSDLKRLVPNVQISGIGGDKLADAGMTLLSHYRDINTIGLSEGFGTIRKIVTAYRTMKKELRSGKHDLFIPVDYPDINLRLCKFAREAGVRVCYFISPQVWAWRKGRIRKIAKRVDRMMTIFPFEETLYRDAGVTSDFVGHTMARDLAKDLDRIDLRNDLGMDQETHAVALVPGSRPAEIRRILPRMCEAIKIFARDYPDTHYILPLAGEHLRGTIKEILAEYEEHVEIKSEPAAMVMAACDSGLVTSGTATLQAALVGLPHAVVYVMGQPSWLLAIKVLKPLVMDVDLHVAIANVLAIHEESKTEGPIQTMLEAGFQISCLGCGRPLFVPELLQHWATPEAMARWLRNFRTDRDLRRAMKVGFKQIRGMLVPPLQADRAAEIVAGMLRETPRTSQI